MVVLDKETFPRDKYCGDAVCTPAIRILDDMGVMKVLADNNESHFADAGGFVSHSGLSYIGAAAIGGGCTSCVCTCCTAAYPWQTLKGCKIALRLGIPEGGGSLVSAGSGA